MDILDASCRAMGDYHYYIYHNVVRLVDPRDFPGGKVKIALPMRLRPLSELSDTFEYQPQKCRFAVRRIKGISINAPYRIVIKTIERLEGVDKRRRLHSAEKEVKEARDEYLQAARKREEYLSRLNCGIYNSSPAWVAVERDRETSRALGIASNRLYCATERLCTHLVYYGTITPKEAQRRVEACLMSATQP